VAALANTPFTSDRSISNASSIAFLAELHGKSLLVGGDARAEVLCRSIAALLAQRGPERLRVDAFVVPHAGSARNMNRELLVLLECDRYLFSTDGSAFQHPDRETIARILAYGRASPDRPLTLVFNYRSPTTEVWANEELQSRYHYRALYPEQNGQGIKLQV
jgi:beta-lactamase superfamily II metal-dependent hydrolase